MKSRTLLTMLVLGAVAGCNCPQAEAQNQEILDRLTRIEAAIEAMAKEPDRLLAAAGAAIKAEEWGKASRSLEALAIRFPGSPQDDAAEALRKNVHAMRFSDIEKKIADAFDSAEKAFDDLESEVEKMPPPAPEKRTESTPTLVAKPVKPAKTAKPVAPVKKRNPALDMPMPRPKTGDDTAF